MKPEQERVHSLLKDTVSLLCKNGLSYTQHLKIEGVLGITVDNDVFIVHLDDKYEEEREKVPVVHPDSSAKDIAVGDEDEFHVKSEPGFIDDDDLIIMESDIKEEPVSHSASRKRPHPRSSEGPQRKVHNLSHRLTQSADVPSRPGSSGEAPYITGVMKDIDSVGDASSYGVPGFDSGGGLEGPSQQQNSPFPHDTINPPSGSWPPLLPERVSHDAQLLTGRWSVHDTRRQYPCTICGKVFSHRQSLWRHKTKVHQEDHNNAINQIAATDTMIPTLDHHDNPMKQLHHHHHHHQKLVGTSFGHVLPDDHRDVEGDEQQHLTNLNSGDLKPPSDGRDISGRQDVTHS